MKQIKPISTGLGVAVIASSMGCAPLSRPATPREQTAAAGGLAGGAGGAIIGSMAGSAVAGGLFGIPIGAVAGWYIGDQMEWGERLAHARTEERDAEINRLRRENERLREEERPARGTGAQSSSWKPVQGMNAEQERQVQRKLNEKGYDPGQVDGVFGPTTQAALRDFQKGRGLEPTGRLNEKTRTLWASKVLIARAKEAPAAAADRGRTGSAADGGSHRAECWPYSA